MTGSAGRATASAQLAERIRAARAARGLTRSETAEAAGLTVATVARLEHGRSASPGFFTVVALARALNADLLQLADCDGVEPPPTGAESLGYEGRDQPGLIAELHARGVAVVADVRLNAVSRRPGFSKTALRTGLAAAGIDYRHFRALGNPKNNRAPFHGGQLDRGRAVFAGLLDRPAPAAELAELAELVRARRTAVLCFERDERSCHRQVILDRLGAARS